MWTIAFWIFAVQANLLDPSKKGKKDGDSNKFVNAEKTIERYKLERYINSRYITHFLPNEQIFLGFQIFYGYISFFIKNSTRLKARSVSYTSFLTNNSLASAVPLFDSRFLLFTIFPIRVFPIIDWLIRNHKYPFKLSFLYQSISILYTCTIMYKSPLHSRVYISYRAITVARDEFAPQHDMSLGIKAGLVMKILSAQA